MTVEDLEVELVAPAYRRANSTLPGAASQGLLPQDQVAVLLQDHFWRAGRSAIAQAARAETVEDLEVKLVAGGATGAPCNSDLF